MPNMTKIQKQIALMTKSWTKIFFWGKIVKIGEPQRQNSGCFQRDTDPFRPVTSRKDCFPYQCLVIQEKVGNSIELFIKKKGKSKILIIFRVLLYFLLICLTMII